MHSFSDINLLFLLLPLDTLKPVRNFPLENSRRRLLNLLLCLCHRPLGSFLLTAELVAMLLLVVTYKISYHTRWGGTHTSTCKNLLNLVELGMSFGRLRIEGNEEAQRNINIVVIYSISL